MDIDIKKLVHVAKKEPKLLNAKQKLKEKQKQKSILSFIDDYYKKDGIVKITNKSDALKDQELYQLLKKPTTDKGEEVPHIIGAHPKAIYQADLIFLPTDAGYKYALVVVDVATGLTDAEPLKDKTSNEVLEAFKKITNRQPLKDGPKFVLQCDSGTEFKGVFSQYITAKGIYPRYGKTGRHRQQAYVENRNKIIGQALFQRQVGEELLTNKQDSKWIKRLPLIIKGINDYKKLHFEPKDQPNDKFDPIFPKNNIILGLGCTVRVILEEPRDTFGNKLLGKFRATDIRWSRTLHTITNVIIDSNEPVLYQVDNIKSPAYTYNQLQFVNKDKIQEPPAKHIIEGKTNDLIVKNIKGDKIVKGKTKYLIEWKGQPLKKDYSWELADFTTNPLVLNLIKEYNEKK